MLILDHAWSMDMFVTAVCFLFLLKKYALWSDFSSKKALCEGRGGIHPSPAPRRILARPGVKHQTRDVQGQEYSNINLTLVFASLMFIEHFNNFLCLAIRS